MTAVRPFPGILLLVVLLSSAASLTTGEEITRGEVYSVREISFRGPRQTPRDSPARDVELRVTFRHETGSPVHQVYGFWDGDGQGGTSGDLFKVRFCPTKAGRWELAEVVSNARELAGQHRGDHVTATTSTARGFWLVDPDSPGRRWFMRSDGSHSSIFGNTHYSFLSRQRDGGQPVGQGIADDVVRNAEYFKKLRFGLQGDRYPHPTEKPFLDEQGRPTDDGNQAHRPNPKWFGERVDLAVRTAHDRDLIADLILCGPDTVESRSTLLAGGNAGDPTPYLRFIAARYGSFPNVWICLCNEYDIKEPRYAEAEVIRLGRLIRTFLPYPTPLSVHPSSKPWSSRLDADPAWNDHQIIQRKIRDIARSADAIQDTWTNEPARGPRDKPTIDDELSYQGAGDRHTEGDTIESHLGAFLGGGYGSTGEKSASKIGQYFWGAFDPAAHSAADNLKWLREVIDAHVTFWKMAPDLAIFSDLPPGSRGMAWPDREYVLGTDRPRSGLTADLPPGLWSVTRYDAIAEESVILTDRATGRYAFDAPEGRAILFHFRKTSD